MRYADDFVGAFQYREDAERFLRELPQKRSEAGETRARTLPRASSGNWTRSSGDENATC